MFEMGTSLIERKKEITLLKSVTKSEVNNLFQTISIFFSPLEFDLLVLTRFYILRQVATQGTAVFGGK